MKRDLTYYGNPILRTRCIPVEEITPEVRELVRDMIETLEAHSGWGLAAPQIGSSLRIFLSATPKIINGELESKFAPVKVFINPKLSDPSEEVWTAEEGCLSVPGIWPLVIRPCAITVEAMDLEGNLFKERLEAYQARCAMHENDHLNGVLNIDRIDAKQKRTFEQHLRALKKKHQK